ncbi:MAG: hypothetical protein ACYCO0_00295 [Candidatus Micrarchaeaceae archaeon]
MNQMHVKGSGGSGIVINLNEGSNPLIGAKRTSNGNWLGRGQGKLIDLFSYKRMKRDDARGIFGAGFWTTSFERLRSKAMDMKKLDLKNAFGTFGRKIREIVETARNYIRP